MRRLGLFFASSVLGIHETVFFSNPNTDFWVDLGGESRFRILDEIVGSDICLLNFGRERGRAEF